MVEDEMPDPYPPPTREQRLNEFFASCETPECFDAQASYETGKMEVEILNEELDGVRLENADLKRKVIVGWIKSILWLIIIGILVYLFITVVIPWFSTLPSLGDLFGDLMGGTESPPPT